MTEIPRGKDTRTTLALLMSVDRDSANFAKDGGALGTAYGKVFQALRIALETVDTYAEGSTIRTVNQRVTAALRGQKP